MTALAGALAAVVLERVDDAISVQDADGRLVYVNDAAARTVGYASPEEMLAAEPAELARRWVLHDEAGEPFPFERLPGRRALRGERPDPVVVRWTGPGDAAERWSTVRASAVRDEDGLVTHAINVWHDITAERRAQERTRFLLDVGEQLARSQDLGAALQVVADVAVPRIADWSRVELVDEDGRTTMEAVAHRDGAALPVLQELVREFPRDPGLDVGSASALRRNAPQHIEVVEDALLTSLARTPRHLELLRRLESRSAMVVPMSARGRPIGLITLVLTRPGRRFGPDDLELAGEVATHCAVAVDNARLYDEARAAARHADRRAAQLRALNRASVAIAGALDTPQVLDTVIDQAREVLGAHRAWVTLADEQDGPLEQPARTPERLAAPLRAPDGTQLGHIQVCARADGAFTADDESLLVQLAGLASVAVEHARLYEERAAIAQTLQKSLLPPALPRLQGLELAACYRPAGAVTDVGGDFYDAYELDGGRCALVLGDVCGKGVSAAALTAQARYTLRAAALWARTPSDVLRALNEEVLREGDDLTLCTALVALVERERDGARLSVAVAGHPRPLVVRADGTAAAVGRPGTMLGVLPDPQLHDVEVRLAAGDTLVCFTDGVLDAGAPARHVTEQEVGDALAAGAGESAEALLDRLERRLAELVRAPFRDDVAMLALRAAPGSSG